MRGTDGEIIVIPPAKFRVFCFLGTQCPLAKLYGPRLQQMADEFGNDDVAFVGVNSNPQDSPTEIDEYARRHAIRFPIVDDHLQSLAEVLVATRTPEVFVVDSSGLVRYQGRIDDQYEPGVTRDKPTRHDLRDAITALTTGRKIPHPKTAAVGCLITRLSKRTEQPADEDTLTFCRDIAPILNQHCVECHREGEIAPMALTDYEEVIGWSQMILEVIDQNRMPPWHADPDVGHFVGERRMPPIARDRIAKWIEQGLHEGDEKDLPLIPEWNEGWQLPTKPDYEFAMRDRSFQVPADGIVEYQYFVVDPQWTGDHWIRAAQVVPGNPSVVHHCIVFVRPPDNRRFQGIGWLGGYVPGQRAVVLPPGHARYVPAGSKLVFQMHYTTNGTKTDDLTRIGVWKVDAKEVTHRVTTHVAIDHEFEIPPGESNYSVDMIVDSFASGGRMLGIMPHMHLRGKSFQLTATAKSGATTPLLRVPDYDFNWQHWYGFTQPLELDQIESLKMSVTFDNSENNPFNPAPSDYVTWGDQTFEEMAVAFYDVATDLHAPVAARGPLQELTDEQKEILKRRTIEFADQFVKQMDADQDGVIERDECPATFQRWGFGRFDHNRDEILDREEIEQAAADRAWATLQP